MELKTHAIVLRTVKYGEAQLIADLFTEQSGRLSFICRIPKTSKAKVRKQFFQPLTCLELSFDHRPNARLQHPRDVRIAHPFGSIPFDPYKLSISLFLSDFLYHATHNEPQNVPLYQYVEDSIRWLDGCQRPVANFHLVFMMRLSRFLGFYPNLSDDTPGCFFDLRNGAFSLECPPHPDVLQPADAARISTLMRMNFETMHLFAMSRDDRNRFAQTILTYYRLHVPDFPELKSFEVLKTLFV